MNDCPGTVSAYNVFAESYLHDFSKPGAVFEVGDLSGDPRLYVFLRQLWDEGRGDLEVEDLLADALIQVALEGTDPECGVVMNRDEVLAGISELISFDAQSIYPVVERRLGVLSGKPRIVVYHSKLGGYCLPYETRRKIAVRNIEDVALEAEFRMSVESKLARYCSEEGVSVEDCYSIMKSVLCKVFRQQGLQFAQFMLTGHASDVFEMSLPEIVSDVVDFYGAPQTVRAAMKRPLLLTLREIIYRGLPEEGEFLSRLARSYTMLFLLQCDPKLCLAFSSMLSDLRIYVCTSVLVPALSEHFLERRNQRYSNLLRQVRDAGAELRVNETIVQELVAHFRKTQNVYQDHYVGEEEFYSEEPEILYVRETMIRAYLHCRMQGQVGDFKEFFEGFVSWGMRRADQELIELLQEEYGIKFVSDASVGVAVDKSDEERLVRALQEYKADLAQARNDASVILMIYGLRQGDNEAGGGIFGYRTWWLSMDTSTERAVRRVFGNRFGSSCYIRADFLNHFVALAPSRPEVERAFRETFPSLVGISLAYHLAPEVTSMVMGLVKEHGSRQPGRVKGILRDMMDKVRSEETSAKVKPLIDYLTEKKRELEAEDRSTNTR